jgi:hypothetical protein
MRLGFVDICGTHQRSVLSSAAIAAGEACDQRSISDAGIHGVSFEGPALISSRREAV